MDRARMISPIGSVDVSLPDGVTGVLDLPDDPPIPLPSGRSSRTSRRA